MSKSPVSRERIRYEKDDIPFSFFYLDYDRLISNVNFDRSHIVKEQEVGRLELISYKYHNDVFLWWYIGYTNGIVDPWKDMKPGMKLQIASAKSINDLFYKKESPVYKKVSF